MISIIAILALQGANPLLVPSKPSCQGCEITLTRLTRLGDRDGEGSFASRPYVVTRDSRGRFYVVTPETSEEPPFVFASNGHFLRRLGRVGDGPGEYRNPTSVMVWRDSVYVLDRQNGRMTVLSPTWKYVRSFNAPPNASGAAVFESGRFAINARVRDADRIGYPHHLFDQAGNYLHPFGYRNERIDPRNNTVDWWWLTTTLHDNVCGIPYTQRYLIELYDANGNTVRSLRREADWYQPFDDPWNITPERAPYPMMFGCWVDSTGLVWVIGNVADRHWASGLGGARPAEGQAGMIYELKDWQKLYDGFIEVIDPVRGLVVAYERFDQMINLVIGSGMVGGVREDSDGRVFLEVLQVTLVRR